MRPLNPGRASRNPARLKKLLGSANKGFSDGFRKSGLRNLAAWCFWFASVL